MKTTTSSCGSRVTVLASALAQAAAGPNVVICARRDDLRLLDPSARLVTP